MGHPPTAPPTAHPARIALISAGVLILELAFIRLVPGEVRAVAYFTNLILMAAFFGLGTGCILSGRRALDALFPVGLALVFAFVWFGRGLVIYAEAREIHYWLSYMDITGRAPRLPLFAAAVGVFVLVALPFLALGQALAREMNHHSRLVAYGWDIAGSLAGTLAFVGSSALRVPPWFWPPLVATVAAFTFARRTWVRAAVVVSGAVFLLLNQSPYFSLWSAYYYVQVRPHDGLGHQVWVNSTFLQLVADYKTQTPAHRAVLERLRDKWSVPYDKYRELHGGRAPESVLILGAGTGNDVNVALWNGAQKVVAVEIEPVMLELGLALNTSKPYQDPRVRRVVDDARHYLHTSQETFDLVIFGTIDSVALVGTQANLRLENYTHTRESLEDAKRRLRDGGLFAMYHSTLQPWMFARMYATLRAAFGEQSAIQLFDDHMLFDTLLMGTNGHSSFRDTPENVARFAGGRPSTDDWPFMYLERPTIAPVYLKLTAVIGLLIVGVYLLVRRLEPARGPSLHFLLLGVGFALFESSAIVRLSLVFGSTWSVNAVVFAAVLLMIFVANWTVARGVAPPLRVAWAGVLLFLAVNWLVSLNMLLTFGTAMRVVLACALIGTPVYFAAICFSRLFARSEATGYALGVNLIGAMAGGVLEYSSMLYGMRAMWLLLIVLYGLAMVAAERTR